MSCNLNFYLKQFIHCICIHVWNEKGQDIIDVHQEWCIFMALILHQWFLNSLPFKYQSYWYDTYFFSDELRPRRCSPPQVHWELSRASSNFNRSTKLQVVVLTPQGTIHCSRSITAPSIILNVGDLGINALYYREWFPNILWIKD